MKTFKTVNICSTSCCSNSKVFWSHKFAVEIEVFYSLIIFPSLKTIVPHLWYRILWLSSLFFVKRHVKMRRLQAVWLWDRRVWWSLDKYERVNLSYRTKSPLKWAWRSPWFSPWNLVDCFKHKFIISNAQRGIEILQWSRKKALVSVLCRLIFRIWVLESDMLWQRYHCTPTTLLKILRLSESKILSKV